MDIGKVGNNIINITEYTKTQQKTQTTTKSQSEVIVNLSTDKPETDQKLITYANPKNMTNEQLWNKYSEFSNKQIGKQLSGVKAYIQGFIDGSAGTSLDIDNLESMLLKHYGLDTDLDSANVQEGGKYSAENLSDTLVQFAKNLSGNNPEKADSLLDAVKKGFEKAEKAWGGELPEISQQTFDLTVEKFEAWKNESTVSE